MQKFSVITLSLTPNLNKFRNLDEVAIHKLGNDLLDLVDKFNIAKIPTCMIKRQCFTVP